MRISLTVLILSFVNVLTLGGEIQVETTLGFIIGQRIPFQYNDNRLMVNATVDTFYSIPYAEPPVGDLRFYKTKPKEPWTSPWDSTFKRARCWQFAVDVEQDEDCLFLNVWTPSIEQSGLPVMIWIHGGAFLIGSSNFPEYDGAALAALNDVIVVSINYRLAAFGFLYAGDAAKGNYALWDQHEAIKWTHTHITAFGGDPDQITLFGQSAGGGSIGHQLIAEQSKDYFQRAILMSGGMVHPWAIELDFEKALSDAYLVGELSGCHSIKSDDDLIDCLRSKDAQRITLAVDRVIAQTLTVVIPLIPVVDGEFITNDPHILMDQGHFKQCDVMVGTTTDDGTLMGARAYFWDINNPDPYSDYEDFHSRIKNYTYTYRNDIILSGIEQQYLDWSSFDDVTLNHFDTYNVILTDEAFGCPTDKMARIYAGHGNTVYAYLFNHLPEYTFYDIPGVSWPWKGIAHAEDIPFIFGKPFRDSIQSNRTYSDEEKSLSLDMMRYYTNFAKTGNPNDDDKGTCLLGGSCDWRNFTISDQVLKSFEIPLQDKVSYRADYCHFWNDYLPKQLVPFTADMSELERQWQAEFDRWKDDDVTHWRSEFADYCELVDIDECSSSPCMNGGFCHDHVNGYECVCADGYEGKHCGSEINECQPEPCENGGTCTDLINGFHCTCPDSYKGRTCEQINYCECQLFGNLHYNTFDGGALTFQGECEYVVSQHTMEEAATSGLTSFKLVARHHRNTPSSKVTHVSFVWLELNGNSYKLQNQLVFIDDIQITTPYISEDLTIFLQPDGAIRLSAPFGLSIELKEHTVSVSLHSDYYGLVSGLCGNCDQNDTNECVGHGQAATICGRQWSANNDCEPALPVDGCLENLGNKATAQDLCSVMSDLEGPFGACLNAMDLKTLTELCEYDLCISLPDTSLLCDHLEHLASVCSNNEIVISDWRQYITSCPQECPAGTTYNSCGTSCPEICNNEGGTTENCPLACTEVCECQNGQVLSDGICTSIEECGCMLPNGRYVKAGDDVMVENCSKQCSCVSGELICEDVSCDTNGHCLRRSGVERCYCEDGYEGNGINCEPVDDCDCLLWGGLHIISFDGIEFDHVGECEYTLLKPLSAAATGYPDFELIGRLVKDSPVQMVSFMREVKLKYQGHVYRLMQKGTVFVDEKSVLLPYSDDQRVNISSRGDMVISTDFGLTVMWNNRNGATLKLNRSTYFNNTAGLCGTCNNIEYDDFTLKSGVVTSSARDFGSSWKTGLGICFDTDDVFICPAGKNAGINARNLCDAIKDPLGALSVCHDLVDPTSFYQACVYDVCSQESSTLLCDNMEMYVARCTAKGGLARNWWMDRQECQPECPEGSQYVANLKGCPKTCENPTDDGDCPLEITPLCVCPEGQYLDGEACVTECGGCYLESGGYMNEGASQVNYDCTEVCTCTNQVVECIPMYCSQFSSCQLLAGRRSCVCLPGYEGDGIDCEQGGCTCSTWGDSHLLSFDGMPVTTQGNCEYILVTNIGNSSVPPYSIIASNVKDYPSSAVAFTRSVRLEVEGNVYNVISGGTVFINGVQEPLPFKDELVTVYNLYPEKIVIEASFYLALIFESPFTVRIKVSRDLIDGTIGLCGTCNGNKEDDLQLANGELAESSLDFEEAWISDSKSCVMDVVKSDCISGSDNETDALSLCSFLTSPVGPFAHCHQYVDPAYFYSRCTSDVCSVWNKEILLCSTLRIYAQLCKEAGRNFDQDWRESVPFCNGLCTGDMTYRSCEPSYQSTCASTQPEYEDCNFKCEEVCRCPDGTLFDGVLCGSSETCGCLLPDGGYIQTNEEWVKEDCSEFCFCDEDSGLMCQSHNCPTNSTCSTINGISGCSCPDFYVVGDDACIRAPCVCTVFGDPHYSTFDGLNFDYQGECEYVLVEKCSDSNEVPYFKLVGQHNKQAPNDSVSYLKYLRLEYGEDRYEIYVNGRIHVNGIRVNMPFSNGAVEIRETTYGYTSMSLTYGLMVLYDQKYSAEIEVSNQLTGLTCGLCGTCTANSTDEFQLPNGDYATSLEQFGAAFRNSNDCETAGLSENPCITNSTKKSVADDVCHLMIRNPGPFVPCFQLVDPVTYYNACVMDVCVTGDVFFSCSSMTVYARECYRRGIKLEKWIDESPQCPSLNEDADVLTDAVSMSGHRNRRDLTISAEDECPLGATLARCDTIDPNRRITCHNDPICEPSNGDEKVCVCREPMLLHMRECIPNESFCYCVADEKYTLKMNDTYISENCEKIWSYGGGDECDYQIYGCTREANCETKSGKRDCYCRTGYSGDGKTSCKKNTMSGHLWGEPHFMSYDGSSFSYHGTCEYTITEHCSGNLDLDYFKVSADFAAMTPSSTASVCMAIRLDYKGVSYVIAGTSSVWVAVDDIQRSTPYSDGLVIITNTGADAFEIKTDFGLKITIDLHGSSSRYYSEVVVYLPSVYEGEVCGLFGDADGDQSDEPPHINAVEFGNKYETGLLQCSPAERGECQENTGIKKSAQNMCNGIINPFETLGLNCHDFADPQTHYESCVFDVCVTMLSTEFMCASYKGYADVCRANGGDPGAWWEFIPECTLPCPDGMVYTDCGTSCQASCIDRDAPNNCDETCIPTCQCPEGTVLQNNVCIYTHYCGCMLTDGAYIGHGETHIFDDCSMECSCDLGEQACEPYSCNENEECTVFKGIRNCYCLEGYKWDGIACSNEPCRSEIWGDLHFITFDGTAYDFRGDCYYTLIKTCNEGELEDFNVAGDITRELPHDLVPVLKSIKFQYNGDVFQMFDDYHIEINGENLSPSPCGKDDPVCIEYVHPTIVLTTKFGLVLKFDPSMHSLDVEISASYYHALCGMCGSCNHNTSDDFLLPTGEMAKSGAEFGNFWAINDRECTEDPGVPMVSSEIDVVSQAETACFILVAEGGLYSDCHDLVDPYIYYHTCVYDHFLTREESIVQRHTNQYAKACDYVGLDIGVEYIAESCPPGMLYDSCGPACPETCSTRFNSVDCSKDCVKTCTCPDGMVLDGINCINPRDCGCETPNGFYIPIGDEFINEDCSQRCVCKSRANVECEAYGCDANSTCEIKSGRRNCHCKDGYTGSGQHCELAVCECLIWTESHFQTFDRLSFTFNEGCSYILLKSYGITGDKPAFILIGTFEDNDDNNSYSLSAIRLEYLGVHYQVWRDGSFFVDDDKMNVPFGDGKVSISALIGGHSILSTDFGLVIYYNFESAASIKISLDWFGMVTGMCGTCNNNSTDDFKMPSGYIADDFIEFGNSWRVIDECSLNQQSIQGFRSNTEISALDELKAKNKCFIIADRYGLFTSCHDFIDPAEHYQTCISDYIKNPEYLCESVALYGTRCKAAGGPTLDWRSAMTECQISCPGISFYQECGTACAPSCADPNGLTQCEHDCIETCVCPYGTLINGDSCVELEECSCFLDDFGVLLEGETYIDALCTLRCQCFGQNLTCDENYRCDENAVCTERDGEHKCHCDDNFVGDGLTCTQVVEYEDCYDLLQNGFTEDGVYTIYPTDWQGDRLEVYCDMTTDGGGWVVFHKRYDGSENFYRNWKEYKNGFGHLQAEFWLGNDIIHYITSQKNASMRVDIVDTNGMATYANYQVMFIESEEKNYRLHWDGFTGDVLSNGLVSHNLMKFSTYDKDNDNNADSCAVKHTGAWWFNSCYYSNLNGEYGKTYIWTPVVLTASEMKVRPRVV